MTFFGTLTTDLAIRILQSVQSGRDAIISDPTSPFRLAAGAMFLTVVVDSENTAAVSYRMNSNTVDFGRIYKKPPSITLGCGINATIAADVLKSLGSNATRLEIFDVSDIHEKKFARVLFENCKNIKEMVVHCEEPTEEYMGAICDLVGAYKAKLTRFEFYGLHQVERRLVVRIIQAIGKCVLLKRFSFCGKYLPLSSLWQDVGSSLEEIELAAHSDIDWVGLYDGIRKNCRNIKVLILNGPRQRSVSEQETAYLGLLKSYANQIEKANPFKLLQNHHLIELCNSCPNLHCSLTVVGNDIGQLSASANRVSQLTLQLAATDNWKPLSTALASCTNLNQLNIRNYHLLSGVEEKVIFKRRFHNLRYLNISSFQYVKSKLQQLGEATGGLKQLELDLDGVINESDDYRPLVLANRALEKCIFLENMNPILRDRTTEQTTGILKQLIRTVLCCRNLHAIELRMNALQPAADVWKDICHRNKLRRISCRLELIDSDYFSDHLL